MSAPESDLVFRDAHGEAIVHRLAPHLLATSLTGTASEAMVYWYFREFHVFVDGATRKVDIFHDWGKATGFHPDARRTFTVWAEERRELNRRSCRGVHTLVESTLLFLALEASSAYSRAAYRHTYRDRVSFEQERQKRVREPSTEAIERTARP
jgi:hypothetical protein